MQRKNKRKQRFIDTMQGLKNKKKNVRNKRKQRKKKR